MWKIIPGFENYEANNETGEIRSLNYNHTNTSKVLKQKVDKDNCCSVQLWSNRKMKQILVHKLIWITFNGDIPAGYQINHKDENRLNNKLDNLELMTAIENVRYGTGIARRAITQRNTHNSKCILCFDKQENFIQEFPSIHEAARWVNVKHGDSNIFQCCTGKAKSAYGFVWKYKEQAI